MEEFQLFRPDAELPPVEVLLEKMALTPEVEGEAIAQWEKMFDGEKYATILKADPADRG